MNAIHLGTWDLLAAALLIVLDAALSLALGLGLHRQILVAAVRMVAQLAIVGLVLRHVFATSSAAATLAVVVFMIAAAAREVATRPKQRLKRHVNYRISAAVVSCTGVATVLLALTTAVRPTPWYEPRYAIPLMGIVLGSVLNAASLALDGILDGVVRVEALLREQLAAGMA
ncbi:ABC transporter permease, partial [Telluria sp. Tellsp104]